MCRVIVAPSVVEFKDWVCGGVWESRFLLRGELLVGMTNLKLCTRFVIIAFYLLNEM